MNKKTTGIIVVLIIIIGILFFFQKEGEPTELTGEPIKIGIITPLTGGVAYWGESSRLGVQLAEKDLTSNGIDVEFIIEDGQLDPAVALSAAQKLINVDGVDAIYSEFNPAAIAVTSFLKDKEILHIYDAAPVSPLDETPNVYKTYLDYRASCQEVAEVLNGRGVERVGVLKVNLEFGDLCLEGIKNVYPSALSETYNAGETDFRTSLSKLSTGNIEVVFNIAFQPETLASLRNLDELSMDVTFIGLSETISPDIIDEYSDRLEGSLLFGLPVVSGEFTARLDNEFPNQTIANYQAAALAYIHTKQIANALYDCGKELSCVKKRLNKADSESLVGFDGFSDRIASFDVLIQEWRDGEFVNIK